MPINYVNQRLLDKMNRWSIEGVEAGVIIVDESTTDGNTSRDRDTCHRMQSGLLARAKRFGFPVFLVAYGANGNAGFTSQFNNNLSRDLNSAIPAQSRVYSKGAFETNGFDNVQLVQDTAEITHVVIMGQSVNACCAATARGAVANNKQVHTSYSIMRGGETATSSPVYFGVNFAGWPNGTTIHAGI